MSDHGGKKEEVLVLTGVRARMAAYQQEIQRKDKIQKKYTPVFKVEDDLGASFHSTDGMPVRDKKPVDEDASMSAYENGEDDVAHVFQRSMNASGRDQFFPESSFSEKDLEEEPEKPQEVKDDEEKQAKEKIGMLLGPDPDSGEVDDEPVVLQAFTAVQRRYLKAVSKLRPQPLNYKKPEAEGAEEIPEAKAEVKAEIKKTINREMTKSRHLTELTTTWDDYYEKAQDKPTEEAEVKRVEEEVKQIEDEINNEWSNYAEKVVEVVVELEEGDDNSVDTHDSDMVKWREEARRLKAEADERKKKKADREERKKKRAQIAAIRKKRAEQAAAKKRAEQEASLKEDEEAEEAKQIAEEKKVAEEKARKKAEEEALARAEAEAEEEARQKAEEAKKKNDDSSDSESSESSNSVDSPDAEGEKKQTAKEKAVAEKHKTNEAAAQKKAAKAAKAAADKSGDSDSDSSADNAKEQKKKHKKKKEKPKEKEKKKKGKKAGKKKGGDDDSDMEDGVPEEYPRNLDGSLWKNPLKFWTNKPKKLNELAPKVIMRPTANSDVFCKSEDAINDNACFYWHKFEGDFNVLVKIKANLKTSYDKVGIMIRQDERNWVMSGLEYFNKRINHSSCITRGISDWSLAPLPDEAQDGIWVAIKRHDNKVECFYSFDLKEWIQTRQGLFPTEKVVKVGVVAACPMGDPFKVVFERFRIQMVG